MQWRFLYLKCIFLLTGGLFGGGSTASSGGLFGGTNTGMYNNKSWFCNSYINKRNTVPGRLKLTLHINKRIMLEIYFSEEAHVGTVPFAYRYWNNDNYAHHRCMLHAVFCTRSNLLLLYCWKVFRLGFCGYLYIIIHTENSYMYLS